MASCPRFPFATEAEAHRSTRHGRQAVVYRCPLCAAWHSARATRCRVCSIPVIGNPGNRPTDPVTGWFHHERKRTALQES